MLSFESKFILQKDDGSKLRSVVFNVETILFTFDDSMASAHTDIIDSDLAFVTTA